VSHEKRRICRKHKPIRKRDEEGHRLVEPNRPHHTPPNCQRTTPEISQKTKTLRLISPKRLKSNERKGLENTRYCRLGEEARDITSNEDTALREGRDIRIHLIETMSHGHRYITQK
jgi:hypothetical protein